MFPTESTQKVSAIILYEQSAISLNINLKLIVHYWITMLCSSVMCINILYLIKVCEETYVTYAVS